MCLGIPGKIIEITDPALLLAIVDVSGVRRQINITCVIDEGMQPADCVGKWVLVHAGFAMARIDEEEARRTLVLMEEIGALQDELASIRNASV